MTNREAIKLCKRVETWQKRLGPLGLGHFRIEEVQVSEDAPSGAAANASVHTSSYYDSVAFWFRTDHVEDSSEQRLDETIVHEWLHVAMRDLDASLEGLSDWIPFQTLSLWEERVNHEREGLVDRLARTIVSCYGSET
jgi:hypothetical protein